MSIMCPSARNIWEGQDGAAFSTEAPVPPSLTFRLALALGFYVSDIAEQQEKRAVGSKSSNAVITWRQGNPVLQRNAEFSPILCHYIEGARRG